MIPVVDGDWFEDDIVARFRQFLRAAFGEQHFEENLRFVDRVARGEGHARLLREVVLQGPRAAVQEAPDLLAVLQPEGLVQRADLHAPLHPVDGVDGAQRVPARVQAKLAASLAQQERLATGGGTPRQQAAAQKEADRLRKVLLELDEYEHDVLYPLASQQLAIDLDDGVKANYPKFGAALKKIPGLEASDD